MYQQQLKLGYHILTQSFKRSHTHSLTHSLIHTLTHSFTPVNPHTHTQLTQTRTHTHSHPHTILVKMLEIFQFARNLIQFAQNPQWFCSKSLSVSLKSTTFTCSNELVFVKKYISHVKNCFYFYFFFRFSFFDFRFRFFFSLSPFCARRASLAGPRYIIFLF